MHYKMGLGDATAIAYIPLHRVSDVATMPAPAAGVDESSDQMDSSSNGLLLLVVIVLGLVAANACYRLWRHRRQKQQYSVWQPTDESRWKAVLQEADVENGNGAPINGVEPKARSRSSVSAGGGT